MKKILLLFIFTIFFYTQGTFANTDINSEPCKPPKPTIKTDRQIDKMLDSRLNLTEEQKKYIKENRPKHRKEMEKTVERMKTLQKEIRDIYLLGIPKFQADLKSAPMKVELVMLKQSADKMKIENRKNFENILTPEQKIEFEKIKKEFNAKKHKPCQPTVENTQN